MIRPTTDALAALYRRAPLGMRLGLGPMREACVRAGHPERALRVVHVAGTNGKGSVCAMLESMARADGVLTGLYTSPHLCKFAERIRIGGAPISDEALETHLSAALAMGPELSFFEAATLAAFLALHEARVDLAIVEVGLGGRLDATNVVPCPAAAAITRIALDHTDLLGSTLEAIAFEKASIAKPGLDVIVGPTQPQLLEVIRRTCAAAGATVTRITDEASDRFMQNAHVGLAGRHQKDNARIAYALAKRLGISDAACAAGVSHVDWPGRMETIETPEGPVLLDAAHNPDGARALASELERLDPSKTALVFGALADKAWTEMIDVLAPLAAHRVYVPPRGRAPAAPADIARRHAGATASGPIAGLALARRAVGSELVVACGSLYLVGELRAALLGLRCDPPIAL